LRRYGEQKTTEDVRAVLEEWKALIEGCELLFLSLPKTMRGVMLGDEVSGREGGREGRGAKSDRRK